MSWTLIFCVWLSALACALGHGQMAGLQLSGLDAQYCAQAPDAAVPTDLAAAAGSWAGVFGGADCVLASSFSALLLAALFGLFARLGHDPGRPLPALVPALRPRRQRPALSPRASPFT